MSKHTKGPWQVENHTNHVGPYTSAAFEIWSNSRHICTVNEHVDSLAVDQANASLISAAPEMLEALEAVHKQINAIMKEYQLKESALVELSNVCTSMIPAISKARGAK